MSMKFNIKQEVRIGKKLLSVVLSFSFCLLFFGYSVLEPGISKAATDTFLVTQTVTSEISFSTTASDVTMTGSLTGISGGTSTGQTQIGILTNENTGYTLNLKSTSSPSMQGLNEGDSIPDYTPATGGVPDKIFVVESGGEFAYTVDASTTDDIDQSFKYDTDDCNTGTNSGAGTHCWLNASTTDERIIYRTSETASTSEKSMIYFKIHIAPNSFIIEDTYQATIVLTATAN